MGIKVANQIDKQDDEVISALEHLMNHKYGYMSDLEQHIDKRILTSFNTLGFLHIGYTRDAETYSITRQGLRYYNLVKTPHKSLFARLFQRKR